MFHLVIHCILGSFLGPPPPPSPPQAPEHLGIRAHPETGALQGVEPGAVTSPLLLRLLAEVAAPEVQRVCQVGWSRDYGIV